MFRLSRSPILESSMVHIEIEGFVRRLTSVYHGLSRDIVAILVISGMLARLYVYTEGILIYISTAMCLELLRGDLLRSCTDRYW
jgi:hypothetical protein